MTAAVVSPGAVRTLTGARRPAVAVAPAAVARGRRSGGPARTMAGYLAVARRRRTTIAAGTAVGLVCAVAWLLLVPATFVATEDVLVLGLTSQESSSGRAAQVNLDDEAQLVGSEAIAAAAAAVIGDDADTVRAGVDVTVPTNTTLMRIRYHAPSAAAARAGASAVAAGYLGHRVQEATDALAEQRRTVQEQLAASQEQLADLLGRRTAGSAALTDAATQRLLHGRVADLAGELATLSSVVPVGGRTVQPAAAPAAPSSPDRVLVLLSGLAGGALLGLLAAAARDHLDRTVADAADVAARLGLPVLATLHAPLRAGSADQRRLANAVLAQPVGVLHVAPLSARAAGAPAALAQTLAATGRATTLLRARAGSAADTDAASARSVREAPDAGLRAAVDRARQRGDLVVLAGDADETGGALAGLADATLLVVAYGETPAERLDARLARLPGAGSAPTGIVGVRRAARGRRPATAGSAAR